MQDALNNPDYDTSADLDQLPGWLSNVLIMAIFGYDEQQVKRMSEAVKVRLLFVYSQIQKATYGGNDAPRSLPASRQVNPASLLNRVVR